MCRVFRRPADDQTGQHQGTKAGRHICRAKAGWCRIAAPNNKSIKACNDPETGVQTLQDVVRPRSFLVPRSNGYCELQAVDY